MYFKLEPGNETYEKVKETLEKCNSYNDQAKALVKELGFERFGKSNHGIAGGISCIGSTEKPAGYLSVGKKWQNLIYPKASNKAVNEKIKVLPIMSYEEFGKAIGFVPEFVGLTYHRACGVTKVGEAYLFEVSDKCTYSPAKGMVEILASEYKRLMEDELVRTA